MVAVAAVSEDAPPNTSNKNFRANRPILPMCQITRLWHALPLPKHGAAPSREKRLEASKQTGIDFAIDK